MFQGTTLITLDDKGRLALPKRARDEAAADGVIVAARHPDGERLCGTLAQRE